MEKHLSIITLSENEVVCQMQRKRSIFYPLTWRDIRDLGGIALAIAIALNVLWLWAH